MKSQPLQKESYVYVQESCACQGVLRTVITSSVTDHAEILSYLFGVEVRPCSMKRQKLASSNLS